MTDDTKEGITMILELLKSTLLSEGVSMGMDNRNRKLLFFDTDKYLETGKMNGFGVDVESLVK